MHCLWDLDGAERGSAFARYAHGQIVTSLPGSDLQLPPDYALQHPSDWLDSATRAVRGAWRRVGQPDARLVGIGVDFTSCTMLPAKADGTPLCLLPEYRENPLAWPKLWKHHGAKSQTARIDRLAHERRERFLDQYGGAIGLEWFFPKMLETLEEAPEIYRAAEVWVEAGDWVVWQLVGCAADEMARSTCQAGYKGMWTSPGRVPFETLPASRQPATGRRGPLQDAGAHEGSRPASGPALLRNGQAVRIRGRHPGQHGDHRRACRRARRGGG